MKAIQFDELGPPEVLHLVDVPEPHAGPGQIRVRVRAAGVNPVDWKIRGGSSRRAIPVSLPSIPGLEAAGIVDEIGEGVEDIVPGAEVFGAAVSGGAAEYAVLAAWALKPPKMSWAEAGGLPMAVETAARGLAALGDLEGRTLLISGAAGGVGSAAVQLALAAGADTVIGTGGPGSQEYLRSLGAVPTTYGPGLAERLEALGFASAAASDDGTPAAGRPVDLALDVAGYGVLPDLVALTGSPKQVVTLIDPTAASLGIEFTTGSEGFAYDALGRVVELFVTGKFTLPVAATFDLTAVAEAHRVSEAGHVNGKLVVVFPDA